MANSSPRAGWYADPEVEGGVRYWDGENWTESRADSAATTKEIERNRHLPDDKDWPEWLKQMRAHRKRWASTGRVIFWWLPERRIPDVYEWGLAAWATPIRRVLIAAFFLLGAALMISDLVRTEAGAQSLGTFVALALGPITAVVMLLVLAQAPRDLVQRKNRSPWPFATHMEGLTNRSQIVGISVYLLVVAGVYVALW